MAGSNELVSNSGSKREKELHMAKYAELHLASAASISYSNPPFHTSNLFMTHASSSIS